MLRQFFYLFLIKNVLLEWMMTRLVCEGFARINSERLKAPHRSMPPQAAHKNWEGGKSVHIPETAPFLRNLHDAL